MPSSHAIPFARGALAQSYQVAEKAASDAVAAGFSHFYIDLSVPGNGIESWDPRRIAVMIAQCQQTGVLPVVHGNGNVPLAHPISDIRDGAGKYLKKELDLAGRMQAPYVAHGGQIYATKSAGLARSAALECLAAELKCLYDYADALAIDIWVENLAGYERSFPFFNVFTSKQDFLTIAAFEPRVKFLLDLGHGNVFGGADASLLRQLGSKVAAMSFSDNAGEHDTHSTLGAGTVNWTRTLAAIHESKWSGIVIVETHSSNPCVDLDFISHRWQHQALRSNEPHVQR